MVKSMNGWIGLIWVGWMGGWIDAWVDGWMGGWMDGFGGWVLRVTNIAVRVLCWDNSKHFLENVTFSEELFSFV